MLYLIKGRAGSGKTRALREKISEKLNTSEPLLIIPEQFSFETERSMLKSFGPRDFKKIGVFSFTRLATSTLKNTPYYSKKLATGGVRAVLMSEAISALEGRLNVYSNLKSRFTSLNPLVEFCKELKYCNISGDALNEKIQLLPDCFLKEKLQDIYLINEAYDALVTQSYFDDTDAINMLCEYARDNKIFSGKTVFLDGFRAFSKQEAECFNIILSQADDVYITLCMDENSGKQTPFYYIRELEKNLRAIAAKGNIIVNEIWCEQSADTFSSDIYQVEKSVFTDDAASQKPSDNSIVIAKCVDKDDECKYVASTIKKLIRSGNYRCRDIAVIERVNGSYKDAIIEELKNLDIPVFDDSTRSLKYEALFVYVSSLLSCVTSGVSTEHIFNYLKSGLAGFSVSEISVLEKYALVWNVSYSEWCNGFKMHPDGFGREIDEQAQARLDSINELRKKVIGPLLKLKKDCEDKTGKEITELVFSYLENHGIQDKLYDLYASLQGSGFPVEAERQAVSWDVLVSILDEIATLGDGKYMSLQRWSDIFSVLVDSGEIGEIPQGLDEIKVGSADRIRTDKLKVVFLVGVNKDEFPLVSVKEGILTDADRTYLTKLGLEIRPPYKDSVYEEFFIGYCAVTAASEKLYLSYKTVDTDGGELFPSEIIDVTKATISDVACVSTTEMDSFQLVESDDSAFSLFAKNYNENNEIHSTLLEYFKNKPEYKGRLEALTNVAGKRDFHFNDSSVSERLFRENMYLSASKVEAYYNCPFSYFLRYGLKAEPLRIAELDPAQSGTIVHLVMEHILQKYPKGDFVSASEEDLCKDVEDVLQKYIDEKMGGTADKSKRFIFLYNHLIKTCMAIISRLKEEFSAGAFEPCGFEVEIGGEKIPAYELDLEKGKVSVKGSVDRIDMMEKDGIKYLRVIDYKTGKKEFKLSELFSGINIQMVLYLMALEKNGKSVYGDFIPSGILYLPSRIGVADYLKSRAPKTEEISNQKIVSGKLSGMILESLSVLKGMGAIDSPKYFPAGYDDAKEKFTGNTFSQKDFSNLSSMIYDKIKKMGNSLHEGFIPAIPAGVNDEGKMCKYCSYKSVCGYEYGDEVCEILNVSHKDAIDMLGGSNNGEAELDTESAECN